MACTKACESISTGSSFGSDMGGRSVAYDLFHRNNLMLLKTTRKQHLPTLPPSHISETACTYGKLSIPGELVRREQFYHG